MALHEDDLIQVAHLARLAVYDTLQQDMARILPMIEQINAVDTTDIAPMAHPLDMVQRLRADVVTETNQRAALQQVAKHTEAGLYLTPQVIE